jgi:hypothetical protein
MDFFTILSEEQIRKAYENGEFENLPDFGKPMQVEDLSGVPEELRMAYKLLKNAGFSPEEFHTKHELLTIEGLIRNCEDPEEKEQLQKKWNEKLLRFNQLMSKRGGKTNSPNSKTINKTSKRNGYKRKKPTTYLFSFTGLHNLSIIKPNIAIKAMGIVYFKM